MGMAGERCLWCRSFSLPLRLKYLRCVTRFRLVSIFLNAYDPVKALPAWFPGMKWKSEAVKCWQLVSNGLDTPHAWVERSVAGR